MFLLLLLLLFCVIFAAVCLLSCAWGGCPDKVEVVNRLRKSEVLDTIRNYTINYDTTWIFDKIQ